MPTASLKQVQNLRTFSELALMKLAESGILPEAAAAAGVYSVHNARAEVDPEFLPLPALVFRFFDIHGREMTFERGGITVPFVRVRFLDPRAGKPGAPPKYMSLKESGVRSYFAHGVGQDWTAIASEPAIPIVMTEGELKALKACSMGVPTIGFSGVDGFSAKADNDD
jgi:hypothetical protein